MGLVPEPSAAERDDTVVHLFGGPYVMQGDRRLDVPEGSKRLLAFVALRRHRVERRHVAGALWPVGDDGRAAGNLRSALWRLRGAGIEALDTDKWSLSLADRTVVDVHGIADWAGRLIDRRPRQEDLNVSVCSLEALDLLPGCYDDWALMERERLRQRVLHALEELSRCLVVQRRFGAAVEAAMMAVDAEPLRESAQRVLIEAHLAEGNVGEARRGFSTYHALLRRELGVTPSREFAALVGARTTPPPARRLPQRRAALA